jgi:hypothetical protein
VNAPTAENADARHEAAIQRGRLREMYVHTKRALSEAQELMEHEDTPRHRQLVHELTVLVDGLKKDLEIKR